MSSSARPDPGPKPQAKTTADSTAETTADPRPEPKRHAARYGLVLLALVTALALLFLSLPRLQASVHYLPVDAALKRYFKTGEVPSAQLGALRQRAEESITRYPHYRYYDGLSLVNYLAALSPETEAWLVRPALNRSLTAAQEAVRRAPASPRTWLRIARTRAALGESGERIVGPLNMSILSGRVEPTLMIPRLELAYANLERLDSDSMALLRDQTLLGWRISQRSFRQALREGRLDVSRIESVIGSHNRSVLQEMEGGT